MSAFIRDYIRFYVERVAEPSWAVKFIGPTFDGDEDAAFTLSFSLSNEMRGEVAVALWQAKISKPAFRAYFASVWDHDHRYVIEAAGTRRRLAAMFRYAAFPLPDELPERVRVWRGTSALTLAQSRAGYSWTINRDVAGWFAMRFAEKNRQPLVLMAEVDRGDISLYHDERSEDEVVLLRPPAAVNVDGDADDWRQRHKMHVARRRKG